MHQAVSNIRRLGHQGKVLIKADGEPALTDLRGAVAAELGDQVVPESTPAEDPRANGVIENGVKQFKGMLRTLHLALEHRLQGAIPVTHPVMCWLVEHSTELLAKHQMGHDGKTPYQRLFGKTCLTVDHEFGETVRYKLRRTRVTAQGDFATATAPSRRQVPMASLDPLWGRGVWLGQRWGGLRLT